MSTDLPKPPQKLLPELTELPADQLLWRVHPDGYSSTQFNANDNDNTGATPGRFHPFTDPDGSPVPTLYASDTIDGALSETVFHNLVGGGKSVLLSIHFEKLVFSRIKTKQPVILANLQGHGLQRFGIKRRQLLETLPAKYPQTVLWAKSLHDCDPNIQGMIWRSGQLDTSKSLILFGDRVLRKVLNKTRIAYPLKEGKGRDYINNFASQSSIAVINNATH